MRSGLGVNIYQKFVYVYIYKYVYRYVCSTYLLVVSYVATCQGGIHGNRNIIMTYYTSDQALQAWTYAETE